MCIVFFCTFSQGNQQPQLVLASNREERTDRKTEKLSQFNEDPNIYGGRDVISGGTWLGVNVKTGLLVFLTNFTLPPPSRQGISRGKIVSHFLNTSLIPPEQQSATDEIIFSELQQLSKKSHEFSPFNLTVCNLRTGTIYYLCSQWKNREPLKIKPDQAYGLSNSDIQNPQEKTKVGKANFQLILSQQVQLTQQQLLGRLTEMMKDATRHDDTPGEFATIFVKPYWSERFKAQRRTKSTTLILSYQRDGKKEIFMKEITYGQETTQEVLLNLII